MEVKITVQVGDRQAIGSFDMVDVTTKFVETPVDPESFGGSDYD